MSTDFRHVQAEFLLPHELRAAMQARSVVYMPLGSYEWHSEHLPIGLDGLTAHGVCLRAAAKAGGIVCPTLYHGTGGGHTNYPWTIMMEDGREIAALISRSLVRLAQFGVETAVLFSGHFADEQLAMMRDIEREWRFGGNRMRVLALGVNMSDQSPIAPDHAGLFETTLLSALWPERVQLAQLPPLEDVPSPDPDNDVRGPHRHDPAHPLYGVFGPDPRTFEPEHADRLLESLVNWLIEQTHAATRRR
jgi:creatinine amidohydrolase